LDDYEAKIMDYNCLKWCWRSPYGLV